MFLFFCSQRYAMLFESTESDVGTRRVTNENNPFIFNYHVLYDRLQVMRVNY